MKIIRPLTIDDAALVSSSIPETDYAAYSAATTYALGARVIVVSTNSHHIYESLQAGNINHTPASSPTWWLDLGNTNRWRMFDGSVTSQSTKADSIDVSITPTGRVNSLALLNISAATVQVKMTDAIDGLVYDRTFSLVSSAGIVDWYSYFFEPIVRLEDFLILDMPTYYSPTIQIILSGTGETVGIGAALVGQSLNLGGTQYGANVGIQDYSVKTRDAYGNYTILERAYNKLGDFSVLVESRRVDQLEKLLAQYRATPVVYIGSELYASTMIYGFYKSFQTSIKYARESLCTLEIEGLT